MCSPKIFDSLKIRFKSIFSYKNTATDSAQGGKNSTNNSLNGNIGITQAAGGDIINHFGKEPRRLNDSMKARLAKLDKSKKIVVTAVLGDHEALKFATIILDYLKSIGCRVEGVNQSIYSNPLEGQLLEETDDGYTITIGGQQ